MGKPFNYGGQAVIEGVMMRGRKHMALAVRAPNGDIVLHSEPLNPRIYSSFINKTPFVRGFTLLWDSLGLGMRALMLSADIAMSDEEKKSTKAAQSDADTPAESVVVAKSPGGNFAGPAAWGSVALALIMAVGIFFVGPLVLVSLLNQWTPLPPLAQHLIEGGIRLALFLAYVWAIGFMEDIRRVFGYHGAEHKTINAYEQNLDLVPEQVDHCTTLHPRCGTAFLLIVMIISIFVFALVGTPDLWVRIISRIVLIPVVAGIAYEFLKFSAAHPDNPLIKLLIAPGLALQRMTTREPDLKMLEVSIAALKKLLTDEQLAVEVETIAASETMPAPGPVTP
jgi:uncharacterized protein YqhQ